MRELESFIKRYLVLGDEQLMIDELTQESTVVDRPVEIDLEAIRHALESSGGNKRAAAKELGISHKVLLHRLRRFGMEPSQNEVCLV